MGGRLGVGDACSRTSDGLGLFALVGLAAVPCTGHLFATVLETLDGGHRRAWSRMFRLHLLPAEGYRLGQSQLLKDSDRLVAIAGLEASLEGLCPHEHRTCLWTRSVLLVVCLGRER